jgi:transcription elongation factor Elf1
MTRVPEVESMEIPFHWTCPRCNHAQDDSVNPVHGPFVSVTCGNCEGTSYPEHLSETDRNSFNAAVDAAEAIDTKDV